MSRTENLRHQIPEVDRRKRKKRKRRRIILLILLIILLVLGFFVFDIYRRAQETFKEMFEPLGSINLRQEEGLLELNLGDDPFSLLILGIDGGRSDSMMVATVNPNLGYTYLLSIPRDTMVPISGHGSTTRINHAFAYGGVDMAVNTVQDFLNIPIDFYVTLQMSEFHSLVDAFGGVTVYNDFEFSMHGHHFPVGNIHLTGDAAYYYARMRMEDPRGDYGRQERQRAILGAMVNELAGVTVITRYQQILDAVGDQMRTNVELNEMLTMSANYNRALRNITNLQFNAYGSLINGMYLIPIPEDQRLEMSNRLRNHLELN